MTLQVMRSFAWSVASVLVRLMTAPFDALYAAVFEKSYEQGNPGYVVAQLATSEQKDG